MSYSKDIQEVIRLSREIAIELGYDHISSYHMLLGVGRFENSANTILKNAGIDYQYLIDNLQKDQLETIPENFYLTKEAERALKLSAYYSWVYHGQTIEIEHFILAMLADNRNHAGFYLTSNQMTYSNFSAEVQRHQKTRVRKLFEALGKNQFLIKIGVIKHIRNSLYIQ